MEPPLGRRLAFAHRAVHDFVDARMRDHGASLWQWILLRQAGEHAGASQRELADAMHIEPPTLVRHLDKLAEEGLVERRRDDVDRRKTRVWITAAGRKRMKQLHDIAQECDGELRSLLTEREVEVLGKALTRIHEHYAEQKTEDRRVDQR
jgi:MarR family transcriptional regulator, transcriptional regulator for hemolysin